MHEAFNDVTVTLFPTGPKWRCWGSSMSFSAYGGSNAYGRDFSRRIVSWKTNSFNCGTMAFVPPAIFLLVTAFLLQVVMTRQIAIQREHIAMLRAFGYTQREIAIHFLQYALVIGLAGALLGTVIVQDSAPT